MSRRSKVQRANLWADPGGAGLDSEAPTAPPTTDMLRPHQTPPSPPRTYYLGTGALKRPFKGLVFGYLGARVLTHL